METETEKKKRGRGRELIGRERVVISLPPWMIEALDREVGAGRGTCRSDVARRLLSEMLRRQEREAAGGTP